MSVPLSKKARKHQQLIRTHVESVECDVTTVENYTKLNQNEAWNHKKSIKKHAKYQQAKNDAQKGKPDGALGPECQ